MNYCSVSMTLEIWDFRVTMISTDNQEFIILLVSLVSDEVVGIRRIVTSNFTH